MATTASAPAAKFAAALQDKFTNAGPFASNAFVVEPGRKYDRIVQFRAAETGGRSVHAFVERATGHVFKSAGWAKPATGVRFTDLGDAIAAADLYGGYLYMR